MSGGMEEAYNEALTLPKKGTRRDPDAYHNVAVSAAEAEYEVDEVQLVIRTAEVHGERIDARSLNSGVVAFQIASFSKGRRSITIRNHSEDAGLYIGGTSQVTIASGYAIPAGEALTLETTSPIYAVSDKAAANAVRILEVF